MDSGWRAWRFRHNTTAPRRSLPPNTRTAQAVYTELVNTRVSPLLRSQGLVGSAGRYSIKSDTHWAQLGFQKSVYSDRAEVRFTVNLLVANRDDWDALVAEYPYHGPRPMPSVSYPSPVRSERIGALTEDGSDKWWRIFDGQDLELVEADLRSDLLTAALPWMREQMDSTTERASTD